MSTTGNVIVRRKKLGIAASANTLSNMDLSLQRWRVGKSVERMINGGGSIEYGHHFDGLLSVRISVVAL